jgi:hypothetical protein
MMKVLLFDSFRCRMIYLITVLTFAVIDIPWLSYDKATLAFHICELLSFLVKHHTYRSKYFLLSSKISLKVVELLRCREGTVKLGKNPQSINEFNDIYVHYKLKKELFFFILFYLYILILILVSFSCIEVYSCLHRNEGL